MSAVAAAPSRIEFCVAVSDPRLLALEVTLDVARGARSDEALGRALDASALEGPDRALATHLTYGTIARQRTLDHTIAARAGRAIGRIDEFVLAVLRLGVFQLAYLDRVPAYAAISTSVELVRRRARSAAGFVNAVLRGVQRQGLAATTSQPIASRLGIAHSCPDWLVSMWVEELGMEDAEALLAASLAPAPTAYRALQERGQVLALMAEAHLAGEPGRYGGMSILLTGEARAVPGLLIPQGEASQLVVEMLAPQPGEQVLDACASPGGKSAYIAALVGASGTVTSVDSAPGARSRIEATLSVTRPAASVHIHETPLQVFAADAGSGLYDAVLADVPCSGLGTLRQHPEIRWRREVADLDDLARRQRSLLECAATLVRPGGRLVYSTCTVSRRENDAVVAGFLASNPHYQQLAAQHLPAQVAALCDAAGTLRTFPHRHGIDGFFAAALQRRQ